MFRFKLGIVIGYGIGWLVTSGKAAELIERFRERQRAGAGGSFRGSTTAPESANGSGVYDFSSRIAD